MNSAVLFLCAALAALPSAGTAKPENTKKAAPAAAATGTIAGHVTVTGKIKKAKKFSPYADVYGGGGGARPGKTDEPGHLLVYLDGVAGSYPPPAAPAVLDQRDRAFSPDLLPVLAGTTVDFVNHDRIYHNVFSYSQPHPFDLGRRGQGEKRSVVFDRLPPEGIGVIKVNCEIHANMRATVLVMRNPYWQVLPETGGELRLERVPAGTWKVRAWHASLEGEPVSVTVKAGETARIALALRGGT